MNKQKLTDYVKEFLKNELIGKTATIPRYNPTVAILDSKGKYLIKEVDFWFGEEEWTLGGGGGFFDTYAISIRVETQTGKNSRWIKYPLY
jgi:hypothetical protein